MWRVKWNWENPIISWLVLKPFDFHHIAHMCGHVGVLDCDVRSSNTATCSEVVRRFFHLGIKLCLEWFGATARDGSSRPAVRPLHEQTSDIQRCRCPRIGLRQHNLHAQPAASELNAHGTLPCVISVACSRRLNAPSARHTICNP